MRLNIPDLYYDATLGIVISKSKPRLIKGNVKQTDTDKLKSMLIKEP